MALVTMQIMKEVNSKMRTLVVQLDEQLQQELEKEDLKQLKVGGNGQSKRLEKIWNRSRLVTLSTFGISQIVCDRASQFLYIPGP